MVTLVIGSIALLAAVLSLMVTLFLIVSAR